MPCGKGEILNELLENPMMNATEPVMKSLQDPIRTEDEVPQNAQAVSRMDCAMLVERFQNGEISAFDEIVGKWLEDPENFEKNKK